MQTLRTPGGCAKREGGYDSEDEHSDEVRGGDSEVLRTGRGSSEDIERAERTVGRATRI